MSCGAVSSGAGQCWSWQFTAFKTAREGFIGHASLISIVEREDFAAMTASCLDRDYWSRMLNSAATTD